MPRDVVKATSANGGHKAYSLNPAQCEMLTELFVQMKLH